MSNFHPDLGLLKLLIVWSAQGTRGSQSGLRLKENPSLFGQLHPQRALPCGLHTASNTELTLSEHLLPLLLILREMHHGWDGGIMLPGEVGEMVSKAPSLTSPLPSASRLPGTAPRLETMTH